MARTNGCQKAYTLYLKLCASPLAGSSIPGLVVELLLPYIRSLVFKWGGCRCPADYDDVVSDCCIELLDTTGKGRLSSRNIRTFVASVRIVFLRLLWHRQQDEFRRLRTEACYVEGVSLPADPATVAAMMDAATNLKSRLVAAMLSRSRFVAVTPALCERTADWMALGEKDRRPLSRELHGCEFWDRYFLARYLQTLYCWSRHDLRGEALAS